MDHTRGEGKVVLTRPLDKPQKPRPRDNHILNILVDGVSHEPNEAENHKASEEAGETVGCGDKDSIAQGVVVELVVGGECDE